MSDKINHRKHYNSHPSGIECIEIIRHMTFNVGQIFKYLWRAGLKDTEPVLDDLKKARWHLDDEIQRLTKIEDGKPTGDWEEIKGVSEVHFNGFAAPSKQVNTQ